MTDVRQLLEQVDGTEFIREYARRTMRGFVSYTKPDYEFNWHHDAICKKLDDFIAGKIKKMILLVPPQHGKSELASRRLPAYILGKQPTKKVVICSYADSLATSFNRDIQRIIDDVPYHELFPGTVLNESNVSTNAKETYLRNSSIFEVVGHRGFVKTVGVGGGLTGTTVDIGIIDDPFKDREEAMSLKTREKVWSWYRDVFCTRLHNLSQQLIIMTRWDEDDLVGRVLAIEKDWEVIKFQGIKEREVPDDPRNIGEALWPSKHSLERLEAIKKDSPITFGSLYQQEPSAPKGLLVIPEWHEIKEMPNYLIPVYGIDFGNPTAIIEVMAHKGNIYLNEIAYDNTNPTNSQIKYKIHKMGIPLTRRFVADSAEPRSIKDLKGATRYADGTVLYMNVVEAEKGPGSILFGLKKLKEFKIHVTSTSHNLIRELKKYQYHSFNGKSTGEPIDEYNHLIDAIRYVILTLFKKTSNTASASSYG